MSSNAPKYSVLPSRLSLHMLKNKIKSATAGHRMLKSKRDALNHHNTSIINSLKESKRQLVKIAKESFLALSAAKITTEGHFTFAVQDKLKGEAPSSGIASSYFDGDNKPDKITSIICSKIDTIAGVHIPRIQLTGKEGSDSNVLNGSHNEPIGIGKGGEQVHTASESFTSLLDHAVSVSEGQIAFSVVNSEYKKTNRRVNALEKVVIPRLESTLQYVQSELEETEKEEFFRLKMVQKKKALAAL
ncbi:vacuolar ATP synthase subunit D [Perkinsela sp. CCAP 1560/4]|nr:vacuolar ATP synthase subunit D [Perkinsela sp. CCAP 1560/4]|eukprot:KNH00555.1 vacuolar ATP synthase subunit D [Perkinsela sp. CCAP 1560/4]